MTSQTLDPDAAALHDRLLELWERTGDATVGRLVNGELPVPGATAATAQQQDDWLSTGLMTAYRQTRCAEVFALLFELNRDQWLRAIRHRLRSHQATVEPEDVLQEAVLNMMRYPHRFRGETADALRNWSHGIIRNTLVSLGRRPFPDPLSIDASDDDDRQPEDRRNSSPERAASEHERALIVDQAWLLFLALYLAHFERLPQLAQRVLRGVELEGHGYRELAQQTGLPVTNLKMVVFRSRRRIFRDLAESLAALERSEPALEPLPDLLRCSGAQERESETARDRAPT